MHYVIDSTKREMQRAQLPITNYLYEGDRLPLLPVLILFINDEMRYVPDRQLDYLLNVPSANRLDC